MNKRINDLAKKIDKDLDINVIREIRRISDEKQIYFKAVWDTYSKYLEEGLGEIPDILYFDKDAYEKTKQFYNQ